MGRNILEKAVLEGLTFIRGEFIFCCFTDIDIIVGRLVPK